MPATTRLASLEIGTAFIAPWRPDGRNVGELVYKGLGSCTVRIPDSEGMGWDRTTWAHGTEVIPTDRAALNEQHLGNEDRNRSSADSPVETVHALCDQMKGATRDEIISACVAKGVNINTAKTQYYAWRRKQR